MLWKEVSWNPLASLPVELDWTSTFTQRKRSAPSMMMFPWEVVLDLYHGWSQRRQLLCHVLKDPSEHGRST